MMCYRLGKNYKSPVNHETQFCDTINNNTNLSSTDPSSTPYGTRIVQVLCTLKTTVFPGKPMGKVRSILGNIPVKHPHFIIIFFN